MYCRKEQILSLPLHVRQAAECPVHQEDLLAAQHGRNNGGNVIVHCQAPQGKKKKRSVRCDVLDEYHLPVILKCLFSKLFIKIFFLKYNASFFKISAYQPV